MDRFRQAILSRLMGQQERNPNQGKQLGLMKQMQPPGNLDPRGMQGILSRGANIYKGGLPNAQSGGGPNMGRPPMSAIQRKLGK